jgi:hypothetical protein
MSTALKTYLSGSAIHCDRCSGLMVPIWLNDVALDEGPNDILAWRCVGCGHILDPVILTHQKRRPEPDREAASKPKRKQARVLSRKGGLAKVG